MDWITQAQTELKRQDLAGWLLYDFRGTNPIARPYLDVSGGLLSRRVFLYVPAEGMPTLLVSWIERGSLKKVPYTVRAYSSRQSLEQELAELLPGASADNNRVAVEYSPNADIPYVSYIDAGTAEMLRAAGADLVSSANLLQIFSAWTDAQIAAHDEAAAHVIAAKDAGFAFITERLEAGHEVRETEVQKTITDYFDSHGLEYDHPPIVGFGSHAGDPHYAPQVGEDAVLKEGDVVLIDLFAKLSEPDAPYADITWMGCYGEPSAKVAEVFEVVRDARDVAVATIQNIYNEGRYPQGREIDRATRDYISSKGYGDAFTHRTGHSIGARHVHGDAVHLDDFETCDTRELRPGVAVTVEPGAYFSDFGVRSEINLVLTDNGPRVTTAQQQALIILP